MLQDAKYILENSPANGFDHSPRPDFHTERLDEALTTENLFSKKVEQSIRAARDELYKVDHIIREVRGLCDPVLRSNVNFRQRFPEMKAQALLALDKALQERF